MQESPQALASWHKHLKQRGHHRTKVVLSCPSCVRSLVDIRAHQIVRTAVNIAQRAFSI